MVLALYPDVCIHKSHITGCAMSSVGIVVDPNGPAAPRLRAHVIHVLTAKFNHHRVKAYHLLVFLSPVNLNIKRNMNSHCFLTDRQHVNTEFSSLSLIFELEQTLSAKTVGSVL